MKVVEVNVGKKIEYSVSKNKITFAKSWREIMMNVLTFALQRMG